MADVTVPAPEGTPPIYLGDTEGAEPATIAPTLPKGDEELPGGIIRTNY